jgi:hypothetical protein
MWIVCRQVGGGPITGDNRASRVAAADGVEARLETPDQL